MRLASFVSPHGFGHAARTSAILRACAEKCPDLRVDLFTQVPPWFFEESIPGLFDYHAVEADVGFAQHTALEIDYQGTLERLAGFIPFDPEHLLRLAASITRSGCRAVLCDISPLGIAVAQAAGLPSILIENFTWDWLYEPFEAEFPAAGAYREMLRRLYAAVNHHIQTRPLCVPAEAADLVTPPVSRPALRSRNEVRDHLGLRLDEPLVVVTMGGVPQPMAFLSRLRQRPDIRFLLTGCSADLRDGNLILLEQKTRIYMPDLIRCADAVVAKLGYGTIAEVWAECKPLAYVGRDFRETAPLKAFADREIPGFEIPAESFHRGDWISRLDELLALPLPGRRKETGALAAAEYVLKVAHCTGPP